VLRVGVGLVLALALAGCARLPPEVAVEVSPPDGVRPNHFAPRAPEPAPAAVGETGE
jgi:hypothetical protein